MMNMNLLAIWGFTMVPRVLTHPHGYLMILIRWEIGLTLSHFVFAKDM
jgi:hypothetical protein